MPIYSYTLSGPTVGAGAVAGFTGIAHVTDHAADGLSRLLAQYAATPRLRGILEIFLQGDAVIGGDPLSPTGVQSLEDLAWELFTERGLEEIEGEGPAVGEQLDIIGKIVGQERPGTYGSDDDIYRTWLLARILVNRTNGTLEQIYTILERIGITEPIAAYEYDPAAFSTEITGVPADPASEAIWDLLKDAKPAGVRWDFLSSTYDSADTFATSTDPSNEITDAARGTENIAGTTGGRISRSDSR